MGKELYWNEESEKLMEAARATLRKSYGRDYSESATVRLALAALIEWLTQEEKTMLKDEERERLCRATAFYNSSGEEYDELDRLSEPDDVVATRDTVDDFIETWGEPHERLETPDGLLLVWENIQTRKGARRGYLFVMDFGRARGSTGDAIIR